MSELTAAHREKLMTDLRTVIADAEEVLKVTADQASAGASELRVRMQERLHRPSTGCRTCRTPPWRAPAPPAMPPTTTCTSIPGRPSAPPPASA